MDRLVVNMIRQESTALAAYEAGELDMVEIPPAELTRVKADPRPRDWSPLTRATLPGFVLVSTPA